MGILSFFIPLESTAIAITVYTNPIYKFDLAYRSINLYAKIWFIYFWNLAHHHSNHTIPLLL